MALNRSFNKHTDSPHYVYEADGTKLTTKVSAPDWANISQWRDQYGMKDVTADDTYKNPAYTGNFYANYSYPRYTSPTAGASYSYGGARPTWNWNDSGKPAPYSYDKAAPDFAWDKDAPTFQWDESGKPGEFSYDKAAPEYNNAYQEQINAMVDSILNRDKFQYDYSQDPLYKQYAEAYGRNGRQAMNDTYAQMAARTGGLASSYAGTAAQGAYNNYMQALNDKIPELYQIAYSMYSDEGNNMRNNLSMIQGLENTDYGRYMDALGQYNTDRNFAYNQWADQMNQYNTDRNFALDRHQLDLGQYNADRNFGLDQYQLALNQYNNDRNFDYGQWQDQMNQYNIDRNFDYGRYADELAQYNADRNFGFNAWADSMDRAENAAKMQYNANVDAYNAAMQAAQSNGVSGANNKQGNSGSPTVGSEAIDILKELSGSGATTYMEAINFLQNNKKRFNLTDSMMKEMAQGFVDSLTKNNDSVPGTKKNNTTAAKDSGMYPYNRRNLDQLYKTATMPSLGNATFDKTFDGKPYIQWNGNQYWSTEDFLKDAVNADLTDGEREMLNAKLAPYGISLKGKK